MSRIERAEAFAVRTPKPHKGGHTWLFVKLTTDDGVVGWGECYWLPLSPALALKVIQECAERHLVGKDPFATERLFHSVYDGEFTTTPDLVRMGAVSGLEMACWTSLARP
jgi:L-alanine-DL-glutamate epimerase-like enolase superfamily enzyme